MSVESEQSPGPANVGTPAESDAAARVREHLAAREGEGDGELFYVGDTPPFRTRPSPPSRRK